MRDCLLMRSGPPFFCIAFTVFRGSARIYILGQFQGHDKRPVSSNFNDNPLSLFVLGTA